MTKVLSQLSEDVRRRALSYKPQMMTTDQWADWGDCVVAAVAAGTPKRPDTAKRLLGVLARFALSLDNWGFEPPMAPLYTAVKVERHLREFPTESTRRTHRTELYRIGRLVNPIGEWPIAREKLGRNPRKVPYSQAELRDLLRAASTQATPGRTRTIQIGLALGLGAGMSGREIPGVYGRHIQSHTQMAMLVGAPGRPDMVIPGRLGHWLASWAEKTDPDRPLMTLNQVNSMVTRVASVGGTELSLGRLRSTYVVALINRDVPVRQLLILTGLKTANSLHEYIVHAQPVTNAETFLDGYDPLEGL